MRYTGTFNIDLLHEELEAAGYVGVGNTGEKFALYAMHVEPGAVDIELHASTDYAALDEVVNAHDHTKKSEAEKAKEEKDAKKAAVLSKLGLTEEELRDLLS
jgi:hypothetical protein